MKARDRIRAWLAPVAAALAAASSSGAWGGPGVETREQVLATFEIHPEFQLELVAMEPIVLDPVDIEFDERGRMFVIEYPGYPTASDDPELYPGKIVMLGDRDGDGIYDERTVFADKFRYADSILPYRGGLLVASPPDLLFVKDTDGDGDADLRETRLSGFAVGNQQHNFNGLTYGLDGWIYAANGGNAGRIFVAGKENQAEAIRWRDFRYNFEREIYDFVGVTSGGFGITMDDYGRYFTTHNLTHIWQLVFEGKYLDGVPAEGGSLVDISDHSEGETASIFPIGLPETRVNHPEQSGYFSGACGLAHYGGGAFPSGFQNNVFVCDVVTNLIHRDVLRMEGGAFVASRDDRERAEFLASRDRWFRPVNLTVGPDGALYVADMHRAVIEHPEWIPDEMERTLDLDAGKEKGRIFRIVPKGGLRCPEIKIDRADLDGAVAALAHPSQWWRTTAQRLLVEWKEQGSTDRIEKFFGETKSPLGRLHALWTLENLGALNEATLLAALRDADSGVRENALRIAESGLAEHPGRLDAVLAMAEDDNPRVRIRVALALSTLDPVVGSELENRIRAAIAQMTYKGLEDRWVRAALVAASRDRAAPIAGFVVMRADPRKLGSYNFEAPGPPEFVAALAEVSGERSSAEEIETLTLRLLSFPPSYAAFVGESLNRMTEGLERAGRGRELLEKATRLRAALETSVAVAPATLVPPIWKLMRRLEIEPTEAQERMQSLALARAEDSRLAVDQRLAALELAEFGEFTDREDLLYRLLSIQQPVEIQLASIAKLTEAGGEEVASRLIKGWKGLGPAVRAKVADYLIYRRDNHDLLLTALENKEVLIGQLNLDLERRRALLRSNNPSIRERAQKLFTDAGVVTRSEALEKMRPAIDLAGNVERGHEQFTNLCAKCHTIAGEGKHVGPELTGAYRKSRETLLHDILDPNAAVDTKYISYTVVRKNGAIVNGIMEAESPDRVTLLEGDAVKTEVARGDIEEMYASGISLMPEELENGLSVENIADLLAFLQQPR